MLKNIFNSRPQFDAFEYSNQFCKRILDLPANRVDKIAQAVFVAFILPFTLSVDLLTVYFRAINHKEALYIYETEGFHLKDFLNEAGQKCRKIVSNLNSYIDLKEPKPKHFALLALATGIAATLVFKNWNVKKMPLDDSSSVDLQSIRDSISNYSETLISTVAIGMTLVSLTRDYQYRNAKKSLANAARSFQTKVDENESLKKSLANAARSFKTKVDENESLKESLVNAARS